MKVLFITNMYPVPDYIYFGIHVKEQIEALKQNEDVEGDVYFINGRENKMNYFKSIAALRNIIEKGRYDLIHIHYGISGLFLLFFSPKIPVFVTLHSGELFQKKGYGSAWNKRIYWVNFTKSLDFKIKMSDDIR